MYSTSAANTRLVGLEVAHLINFLKVNIYLFIEFLNQVYWIVKKDRLVNYSAINIVFVQDTYGASIEDFHIIGHSLGSQIAGYAGERIQKLTNQKIGRISALDPAAPLFENMPTFVRLDPSDAIFVDVIHSDASSDVLNFGEYQIYIYYYKRKNSVTFTMCAHIFNI